MGFNIKLNETSDSKLVRFSSLSLSQASVVSHEHYVFTPLQVSEVGQRDQIVVVIIPRLSTATSLRSITRSPFAFVALSLSISLSRVSPAVR